MNNSTAAHEDKEEGTLVPVTVVSDPCDHVSQLEAVVAHSQGCEECLQTGDRWLHLRVCMICGHVGCCDGSPNRHATKHAHSTQHTVVKSFEPGETWMYCYEHRHFMEE